MIVVPLLVVFLAAGCASSQKMFEKARELENRGDYLEASREYIDVLERESDWTEARSRLAVVGPLAVDTLLARSRSAEASSSYPRAVVHLDALDALREAASNVGVPLDVPADYAEYRRDMIDGAIAYYMDAAREEETADDWGDAITSYDRALAYDMPDERRRETEMKKAHVHFRWAEDEMGDRRYRRAYGQAEQAMAMGGDDARLAEQIAGLQDEALYNGTRFVALLPLMSSDEWEREAPTDLLSDLEDAVHYEYWKSPPLFIETVDQAEIRGRMRDLGYARRDVDAQEATRIGRAVEAEFVVVGELRRYEEKEDIRSTDTKRVGLRRSRADTTYALRTMRVRLRADGRFYLSDMRDGRVVAEFTVSATDEAEYRRASFDGDVSTLDLSRREQDYFGAHLGAEAVHEAQDRLLEKLAQQIADRSFDAVLNRIP